MPLFLLLFSYNISLLQKNYFCFIFYILEFLKEDKTNLQVSFQKDIEAF